MLFVEKKSCTQTGTITLHVRHDPALMVGLGPARAGQQETGGAVRPGQFLFFLTGLRGVIEYGAEAAQGRKSRPGQTIFV